MLKRAIFIIAALVVLAIVIYFLPGFAGSRLSNVASSLLFPSNNQLQNQEHSFSFVPGETIDYDVRLHRLRIGRAQLSYQGIVDNKATKVISITFLTDVANLYDLEMIYADINTFNPLWVIRELNFFGAIERIEEDYARRPNSVYIAKLRGRKSTTRTIDSDYLFQHVITSLYQFRTLKGFSIGSEFVLNLPLTKIKLVVKKIEEIRVPAGKFQAVYIESIPKKYKIWLSADANRIPLRVEGIISFAPAAMTMTGYRSAR
jgi:hypothetical protein